MIFRILFVPLVAPPGIQAEILHNGAVAPVLKKFLQPSMIGAWKTVHVLRNDSNHPGFPVPQPLGNVIGLITGFPDHIQHRCLVSSLTLGFPLRMLDTVVADTPHLLAISFTVIMGFKFLLILSGPSGPWKKYCIPSSSLQF